MSIQRGKIIKLWQWKTKWIFLQKSNFTAKLTVFTETASKTFFPFTVRPCHVPTKIQATIACIQLWRQALESERDAGKGAQLEREIALLEGWQNHLEAIRSAPTVAKKQRNTTKVMTQAERYKKNIRNNIRGCKQLLGQIRKHGIDNCK